MALSLRAAAFAALTLASLSGCAGLTDVLAAGVPSAGPSAAASTAPAANTNTNTSSGGSTATNPKPSTAPTGAAACSREKDDSEKDNGTPKLGDYDNQYLPEGWVAAYKNQAEVTDAIAAVKDADWPCFQKFYPGATTVFLRTNVRK